MLKVTLIACGQKMPGWVSEGAQHFAKHLQEYVHFTCIDIPLEKRTKTSVTHIMMQKEAQRIKAVIPSGARLIALEVKGQIFTSEALAKKINDLQLISSHLCFIIGGPDGIDSSLLAMTSERWSLSSLTLPHTLVRVFFIEALYRACSILHNSPYHR